MRRRRPRRRRQSATRRHAAVHDRHGRPPARHRACDRGDSRRGTPRPHSQPGARAPTSRRRPPLPWRTRIDPRRWSRACSASASASWIRSPARHSTTIIACSRQLWRSSGVWRMTATISSTVGGGVPCCGVDDRRGSRAGSRASGAGPPRRARAPRSWRPPWIGGRYRRCPTRPTAATLPLASRNQASARIQSRWLETTLVRPMRERRRRRAGFAGSFRRCARTPRASSRRARDRRRSRGRGARTRRSTPRSPRPAATVACGRRCARAATGTGAPDAYARAPTSAHRTRSRASPARCRA